MRHCFFFELINLINGATGVPDLIGVPELIFAYTHALVRTPWESWVAVALVFFSGYISVIMHCVRVDAPEAVRQPLLDNVGAGATNA